MTNEEIRQRVQELIMLADEVISTSKESCAGHIVSKKHFMEFRGMVLDFLRDAYSEDHKLYIQFDSHVNDIQMYKSIQGKVILKAVLNSFTSDQIVFK